MKFACGAFVLVAVIGIVSGVLLLHLRSTGWSPGEWQSGVSSTFQSAGSHVPAPREHDGTVQVDGQGRTWIITVRAPREKLVSATASFDGSSVQTATRENGGIIDDGGGTLATLVLPRITWRWEGKVDWVFVDGDGSGVGRELKGLAGRLKPISDAAFRWLAR